MKRYKNIILIIPVALMFFSCSNFNSSLKTNVDNNLLIKNLNKEKIFNQQKALIVTSFFLLSLSIAYILRSTRLSKKLNQNLSKLKKLNHQFRDSFIKVESSNLNLERKNEEINKLLNFNERILFSKILKISTYNDIISKISEDISKLIESEQHIKANHLFSIEKTLKSMINESEIWDDFKIQFEKTRPSFFKKLKEIAPGLSVNDLKHCSYIIAKLRTKDVANLINVSPRSVETTRYRIKKKLSLDKNSNLFDFLQRL